MAWHMAWYIVTNVQFASPGWRVKIMDLTDPASALTGEDPNTVSEKGRSGLVFLEATLLCLLGVDWDKANTMQLLTAKLVVQKKQLFSLRLQALLRQRGN